VIRNENEYQEAVRRIEEEKNRLVEHEARLERMGLNKAERKRALDPLRSFHLQRVVEVESYDRHKRGDFDELVNFHGLGNLLIALRISHGLTQRELAERLGIHESQISRDERNEYHGITVERASRILEAMGAELHSIVRSVISAEPSLRREATSETPRRQRAVHIESSQIVGRAASFQPAESQSVQSPEAHHAHR
jgi:transcriptional regulator with XRE-family HTH domain